MKKRAGFIKNIIMVVASALTLVAVSFAWFTSNFKTNLDQYEAVVSGEAISVDFYQMDENREYQPLPGDIELDNFTPGEFNQYKFVITTKTADKLKMSFKIEGIPEDIPAKLAEHVCIKYSVYSLTTKTVSGNVSYVNKAQLASSGDEYVPLSDLNDGVIFQAFSLANSQKAAGDKFAIYYEIGLSEDAPASLGGLESSLGSISISAQRIG